MERLSKEILRVCRALISELQLRVDSWPDLLPIIQSVLNHSPSGQRNNYAPVTVFTELAPSLPIATFLRSHTGAIVTVEQVKIDREVNTEKLVAHMADLHPVIHDAVTENPKGARHHLSKGHLPNLTDGYYVLVARDEFF